MAVVPSPGVRDTLAESLISDLGRVSEWCDLFGMKLNASNTKTMIVSRSRTMHPQSPSLIIGGTVLMTLLYILGECSMIDRFMGDAFCFSSCPFLEYCSAVWCSVADTPLKLLDHVVSGARFRTEQNKNNQMKL